MALLRLMAMAREGDRREGLLMRQGQGWFQLPGMGHEAIAAIAYQLRPTDYIVPHYRDRALMLARGVRQEDIARDFLARAGSSSQGRNLPAHYSARHLQVFSIASPVGAQCLPAAGIAWGLRQRGSDQVVLCNMGEASTRQGEFYEALCFAVQERLPIVFLVEDNGYSISTPTQVMVPHRLGMFDAALLEHLDGRDAFEVYLRGGQAIAKARAGGGPTVLWCALDRLASHSSADDQRKYRAEAELAQMAGRDPLPRLATRLMASGELSPDAWQDMLRSVARETDALYAQVVREPVPDPAGVTEHLYGPPVRLTPLPWRADDDSTTMVAAINHVFEAALQHDPRVLMFGQDIADPKGGVFGFTKGLSSRFPGRVVNAPVAEASIVGLAVGLAALGYRPVFEIQFIDFLTPGFHQLVSQAATLRWRSAGTWSCPLVLYAPYGAYLPAGGMWHSQANDGWWAHTPGLHVAVPSTPEDACGLFWSAIQSENPCLVLIPKHLARVRRAPRPCQAIPFGQAAVRREGGDVTLVSWGNCLELAEQAAEHLAAEGVGLEVIDLRTLVPCDWATIQGSLAKTGRLVVVHEDNRTCSFGQALITEIVTRTECFHDLLSPPQLVARQDVHVPFCPSLEYTILPDLAQIVQAVYQVME